MNTQAQAKFNEGLARHQAGQLTQAQGLYEQVLKVEPRHCDALHLLGVIARQTNNSQRAVDLIGQALEIDPKNAAAHFNRGNALLDLKQHRAAVECYDRATRLKPDYAEAYNNRGNALKDMKQDQAAIKSYDRAIALMPDCAEVYYNRGIALNDLGRHRDAIESYDKAIALKPDNADAYANRGNALNDLNQHRDAIDSYNKAIALKSDCAEAYSNRGIALNRTKQHQAAITSYDLAIALKPDRADAYYNRGIALNDLGRHRDAIESYDKAIALKPDYADAYVNRGIAQSDSGLYHVAIFSCDKAIALKPECAQAYTNRGIALKHLKQHQAALSSYEKALSINPNSAEAYCNRAIVLNDLGQHQMAIASYEKALSLKPDCEFLHGMLVHSQMHGCDWHDVESQVTDLLESIGRNEKVTPGLPVLALTASLFLQRKAAEIWVNDQLSSKCTLGDIPRRSKSKKIRIGYYSADFRNHAVSFLTAGLFETHVRSDFEIYAFSLGQDSQDAMRLRLERAFDKFMDVKNSTDNEIAKLSRELEIDIAIDLGGLTNGSRPGIFALRAAPIQVNYLGYPGTMGAEFMDYLIADKQLIPEQARAHYAEKIVYLPCFQANDSKRAIANRVFTREELGLPQSGFVFCCFNNSYKITPRTFDCWMRILKRVDASALILSADNEVTADNLRREASQRGVDASRLVFCKKIPVPDYLARYRIADLFLDTAPFNGGTTVSDALWAGLPVLTCTGEAFASRMAASLLHAIGLPELITSTQEDYEAMAVDLATHPERLKAIKNKLERNRLTAPLFDTRLFTRHIEAAYTQMVERYHADLPPEHIDVTNLLDFPMKTFLHVGCGPKHKEQTTRAFNSSEWKELRLDIDPSVQPDIIGTMTDMSAVPSESVDAVFSSHNIEHLYPHEVPLALAEFKRVLKPDGFVVITCPDLQSVCALIAEDKLTESAYTSSAGPIAPLDILYGHRPAMARGNLYMAHRCGFTQKVLTGTLQASGFVAVAARRREHPHFDLSSVATKSSMPDATLRALAAAHFA